jgi:SacI restriction endonuclease
MKRCLEHAFDEAVANITMREEARRSLPADGPTPALAAITPLPERIGLACEALVTKGSETSRLAALTAIAGTTADPVIRPNIFQAKSGGVDLRSLYKKAIRPVLIVKAAEINTTWHPSADPFVSNPFREGLIDEEWVTRRKLPGADQLLIILQYAASNPALAGTILLELAALEFERLLHSKVDYRIPLRLTTAIVTDILQEWLLNDTGGRRLESTAVALLRFAGQQLSAGWHEVESHRVNDPTPYDAICKENGEVRVIGEVKDQALTLNHLRQLAEQMTIHETGRGYIFTHKLWWPSNPETETDAITEFIRDRSVLGQRIDVIDIMEAARVWLALIDQDDEALPTFIKILTAELDEHALPEDRRAIADLLRNL